MAQTAKDKGFVIGWKTHTGTYTGTPCVEMAFLTILAMCLYMCVVLSSLTLLASVFVLFILMSRMEDSRTGVNEGDQESRARQEPERPPFLAQL